MNVNSKAQDRNHMVKMNGGKKKKKQADASKWIKILTKIPFI